MRPKPSVARLRELFVLDEKDGTLTRRIPVRGKQAGEAVGGVGALGYATTRVDRTLVYVHAVVFALTYGRWPEGQVDHINGIRSDNRPCNLREVTAFQNHQNIGLSSANTSGATGVYWNKAGQKWVASIKYDGKQIYLGCSKDFATAKTLRRAAEIRYRGKYRRPNQD